MSEEVGKKNTVVLGMRQGVMRRSGGNKVGRDELRALVHELVERMLTLQMAQVSLIPIVDQLIYSPLVPAAPQMIG